MKHTRALIVAFYILHSSCFILHAAVPIKWTVETSRVQPVAFDAYHGETIELEATFTSYGKGLAISMPASLWYHTNGMGTAWWNIPANVSSNTITATFTPASDPGSPILNCFLGGTASTYRAAFQMRFRNSPGKTPNVLDLPKTTYDAALFGMPTINGTNLTDWIAARSTEENDPIFTEWVRTNDFSSVGSMSSAIDTNAVLSLIAAATNGFESGVTSLDGKTGDLKIINNSSSTEVFWDGDFDNGTKLGTLTVSKSYGSLSVITNGGSALRPSGMSVDTYDIYADMSQYAEKDLMSSISNSVSEISETISAWQNYWGGDDVRLTVTNYYGSAGVPSLYLEQKMATNATHSSPWFKTIWDERTRWDAFLGGYQTVTNNIAQNLADRAWGIYDSSTGEYSPEGLLQVSQERVMIASGMAYQKTVTTGGCSVWVLKSTEPTTISGVTSNGFFRIEDGDGNALFEIVKGNKRTVGATATNLSMVDGEMVLTYNSVSAEHPTLELCTNLGDADWKTEDTFTFATVSWSGESGAWVATVTPVGILSSLFVKASYEAGGNTYIKNNVASSLDKVVVGGVEYNVTVQTINGKKLLVLE